MSRNNHSETKEQATLHPVLDAALGCVDVQLDQELNRYRRQRNKSQPFLEQGQPYPPTPVHGAEAIAIPAPNPDPAPQTPQPTPQNETPSPQGYLASSEQLLQNVEDPDTPPEELRKPQLITPLGIASIVLLGASFSLLGFAFLAPEQLNNLTRQVSTLWRAEPEPSEESAPTESPVSTSETPQDPLDIEGPNLATDEFSDVDLDSLSSDEANPDPSDSEPSPTETLPSPVESPVAEEESPPADTGSSDLTSAILSPDLQQPDTPENGEDSASETGEEARTETETSNSGFFYVVVDYNGASSIENARSAVPEAYLREFPQGTKIQMGAFDSEEDAKDLVSRLQSAGVSASVYRPE